MLWKMILPLFSMDTKVMFGTRKVIRKGKEIVMGNDFLIMKNIYIYIIKILSIFKFLNPYIIKKNK